MFIKWLSLRQLLLELDCCWRPALPGYTARRLHALALAEFVCWLAPTRAGARGLASNSVSVSCNPPAAALVFQAVENHHRDSAFQTKLGDWRRGSVLHPTAESKRLAVAECWWCWSWEQKVMCPADLCM